jgi:hypothetical protein
MPRSGGRGERAFAMVTSFSVGNRARSGITRLLAAGDLFITGDDHLISARNPVFPRRRSARTGRSPFRTSAL